jgi:hypothetical protein
MEIHWRRYIFGPGNDYAGAKMTDALACNSVSFASPRLRENDYQVNRHSQP